MKKVIKYKTFEELKATSTKTTKKVKAIHADNTAFFDFIELLRKNTIQKDVSLNLSK